MPSRELGRKRSIGDRVSKASVGIKVTKRKKHIGFQVGNQAAKKPRQDNPSLVTTPIDDTNYHIPSYDPIADDPDIVMNDAEPSNDPVMDDTDILMDNPGNPSDDRKRTPSQLLDGMISAVLGRRELNPIIRRCYSQESKRPKWAKK